jgi:hypothetical protein
MKTRLLIVLMVICTGVWITAQAEDFNGKDPQRAVDPGKPDIVSLDSVQAKAGQNVEMALRVLIDDKTSFNDKEWEGIGSFCIPVKYDIAAVKIDSVRFKNTVLKWDEKFTNKNLDSGRVSFAGIYTLAGAEKPALYSPKEPMEIAVIYMKVKPDTKPGKYLFELTTDPLQGDMYFGSTDGFHSWKPQFVAGKLVVLK